MEMEDTLKMIESDENNFLDDEEVEIEAKK